MTQSRRGRRARFRLRRHGYWWRPGPGGRRRQTAALRELAAPAGRSPASALRLPRDFDVTGAERGQALRRGVVLHEADVVERQQSLPPWRRDFASRRKDFSDMRPLTMASGTRRALAREQHVRPDFGVDEEARIRAPVIEEAFRPPMAYRRVRTGATLAPAGAPASSAAEVTVPLVTSTLRPGSASSASISGSAATHSPTLAPCTQTSVPSGRGRDAWPSLSPMRNRFSLPRLARRRSNAGASGSSARMALR